MLHSNAFSLLEIGVSVLIVGALIAFIIVSYERAFEEADAQALQAGLLTFQNLLIEGSQRSEMDPKELDLNMIVAAIHPNPLYQWQNLPDLGSDQRVELRVRLKPTRSFTNARGVAFRISDCGDVCPLTLTNFSYYHVVPNPSTACPEDPVSTVCNYLSNE